MEREWNIEVEDGDGRLDTSSYQSVDLYVLVRRHNQT